MNRTREKTTATLLIAIFLISMFAVGVQAMHFLGLRGSDLSVTSKSGLYPEETVLGNVVFDAQSGQVTIAGSISELYLASGGWPDVAYLEIGVRPEATKEETNAGVYMIVFGSSTSGILAIHLQDYGGQRPPCPPYPAYISVEKAEKIDYKITLIPSGEYGGTAYLELWDEKGTYQEAPSQEYGYSDANTLNEDFSEARLFYSLMADGDGDPDITYSATIGDIMTNIPLPHIPKKAEAFWVVADMDPMIPGPSMERGVQKYSQEGTIIDDDGNTGTIVMDVSITNFYKAFDGKYARARVSFTMTFIDERVITGIIVGKIWFTTDPLTQHVEGKFVGKGSHVKGTISLIGSDPNVLLFEGMEW